ncbi:carboxylesterase family protein [Actinoplanes bogorensis]|uniref:Carboxylic ester hydrolase n=1 Tax=Paractinoplanes bogorensis TaxID=1610840 RepID=A0ABS5Z5G7_9ACTN|nr:carboxylesterase family protein [Actinoplanes bogorensis]MBU2670786.1 carboxylesterase family protein [Actinoplanes bogorensis]
MVEVRISSGVLGGQWESDVAVFRGIPYAAPPIGANRFAAPQPTEPWDGVRPALAFGPPVPQSPFHGGEDWLTVNVWSPDLGAAALPVMVWIHGGGYMIGSSSRPEYDGGNLARDGRVVVVTLNYRLGAEGFASFPGAPPNRGLLDQVAALEWVRDNIAAFGGDPARVTVFGESAGGGSVAALLAMPRAAGLFHRAIAQSVPGTFFSPELAADIAASLDADADPAQLVAAVDALTPQARWGLAADRSILFAPVVDGDILPATPWEARTSADVALLAGHTRDEHRLFTAIAGPATGALARFAPSADAYRDAFPGADLDELVLSDWLFRMPSLHLADAHRGPTWFYELTWAAPVLGACHGLDVPLVFGNLTSNEPAMLLGEVTPEVADLSARMRRAWTAFATTGDPGWPLCTQDERLTRIFDMPDAVTPYPEQASRKIWRKHTFAPLRLE